MMPWKKDFTMGDDKIGHFLVGLSSVLGLWVIGLPVVLSLVFTVLLLYGKELFDSLGYGTPDWWDLACGLVGMLTGVTIIIMTMAYSKKGSGT